MSAPAPGKIRVLIAEKNPLLRMSLVGLFAGDERFAQAEATSNGQAFLDAVDQRIFDVGLIGWQLPGVDGAGVLRALAGRTEVPRIIIYTGSSAPDLPHQAMILGAAAFCSKRDWPNQLLYTVRVVAAGRMAFPHMDVTKSFPNPMADLTSREHELLATLSDGLTNQQIASQFAISVNTVKFHLRNLYEKIDVQNRAQAVAFFIEDCRAR
jgi:two-component system nitrate/nitrite response regulator NarP